VNHFFKFGCRRWPISNDSDSDDGDDGDGEGGSDDSDSDGEVDGGDDGDLGLSDSQWEQSDGKNGGKDDENMIQGMEGVGQNMEKGISMKEGGKEQGDSSCKPNTSLYTPAHSSFSDRSRSNSPIFKNSRNSTHICTHPRTCSCTHTRTRPYTSCTRILWFRSCWQYSPA
jgi:hypothetical protein